MMNSPELLLETMHSNELVSRLERKNALDEMLEYGVNGMKG
jgi:hypothetical protein